MRVPNVDVIAAEAAAHFTAYLWCTVIHRKHHKWTGDYRRDCLKCRSWYVWPEKMKVALKENPVSFAPNS